LKEEEKLNFVIDFETLISFQAPSHTREIDHFPVAEKAALMSDVQSGSSDERDCCIWLANFARRSKKAFFRISQPLFIVALSSSDDRSWRDACGAVATLRLGLRKAPEEIVLVEGGSNHSDLSVSIS